MEIDDRVHQEIEEGQLVEPGCFTLSLEIMLSKLTSFKQKEPLGWIGRLVQAAVASQANRIEIKHHYEFYFEPACECSLTELERVLLNPHETVAAWLEHLRCALWCLGWDDQSSFTIGLRGNLEQLTCRRGAFSRRPATSLKTFLRVEFLTEPEKEHWRKTLNFYSHCSPIPVLLGDRRLDRLEAVRKEPMAASCSPRLNFPALKMPSGTASSGKGFYRLSLPARTSGSVLWTLGRCGKSLLRWVDNGVVVDSEELSADLSAQPLSVVAYASAEGLTRDASGLQLVHEMTRDQRKLEVLRALVGEIRVLKLAYQRPEPFQLTPLGNGAVTAGLTTTVGLLLGDVVFGGVVSLFTGAMSWACSRALQLETRAPDPLLQRQTVDEADLARLKKAIRALARI